MTTANECVHCDHLTATIEAAHERALVALTTPGAGRFDAVVWLSAHLAAIDHVVAPMLRRHVAQATEALAEDRRVTAELHRLLRILEQHAAADALAPRRGIAGVRSRVVALLTEHAATEHHLLEALARAIGPEGTDELARRYEHAVAHGPTRPHPHGPRAGLLGRAAYAVESLRDHVMDVLDSRHVPLPRQRKSPRPSGRWGHYILGESAQQSEG